MHQQAPHEQLTAASVELGRLQQERERAEVLRRARWEEVRQGTAGVDDRVVAEQLLDIMEGLLARSGAIFKQGDEYGRMYRILAAVLRRLGIPNPNRFRKLALFEEDYRRSRALHGSRSEAAADLYEPVRRMLDELEWNALIDPIDGETGWPSIDTHVRKLRARFRDARDAQDYKAVGLLCTTTLQLLGQTVFKEDCHLPVGEQEPGLDDAKRRIGFYVDAVAPGHGDACREIRKLSAAAARLAEVVKHAPVPSEIEAGIAADATIQVVYLVRRLSRGQRPS